MKTFRLHILTSVLYFGVTSISVFAQEAPIYKDSNAPLEKRVEDLVSQMTLEEKIAQMSHLAPAIERLGVKEYGPDIDNPLNPEGSDFIPDPEKYRKERPWENTELWKTGGCLDGGYWNEALHGVARSGLSTVFPQVIGLGSTWNPELVKKITTAISDEARIHHQLYGKKLTYWSPTINMLRDPRWGRTEEAYSEDPYLQSRMAVAFVKGLQGEDKKYLKTVATVKHFVANNSEVNRHDGSSDIPERQLREYYFPAFKAAIQEGGAYSVMGAYNALNGVPACANDWLMSKILRDEWGFKGYVVSDCGAISDIVHKHKYKTDPEEAVAAAAKAGCDLECETCETEQFLYDKYLPGAVKKGLISEAQIDENVKRIFRARFRLGEFDSEDEVPFSNVPVERLDSDEHRQLALQAARESIILLKNRNGILPLNKNEIKSVAVIGPNADLAELGGYTGTPSTKVTPLSGIREKVGAAKVHFAPGSLPTETIPTYKENALRAAKKSDAVILVLGTSLEMANEGKDRSELGLPKVQEELMKEVLAVNPNTVLVLMNGTPLSLPWAQENVPAILESWYPGQSGGTAIADVLFGDYNPGGKTPLTFYATAAQLPEITDYDITKGRTYWYQKGEPLYPFGFGLSYSTFEVKTDALAKNRYKLKNKAKISFNVQIENTSNIPGSEVIQVYVKDETSKYKQPLKKLRAFRRVFLQPKESKTIAFELSAEDFQFWNPDQKKWQIEKGYFELQIATSSSDKDIIRKHRITVFE